MMTRRRVVALRLTTLEHKELARTARRQRKRLGAFIRDAALAESSKLNARELLNKEGTR